MEMLGLIGMLGICSIEDLWKKRIHLVIVAGFALFGLGLFWKERSISLGDMLGGMGIGLFLYCLSILSMERIGKGDALLLTATGIYLGFWRNMVLLWLGSMLTGVAGLLLYLLFHKKREYRIPFAPFLLTAYLLLCIVGVLEGNGFWQTLYK